MLAALLAAIGMYLLTDTVGQGLVERIYMSESAQNQRNLATVSSFQAYAREFNLASYDTEQISRWAISQDDKGRYIRQERWSGSCSRSFYVGDAVKPEDVHAKFENGILQIALPKQEQKKLPSTTAIAIE